MKSDITNRKDIELLVNTFYEKIRSNPVLGYIFDDVAKINWGKVIFQKCTLFGQVSYWVNTVFQETQCKNTLH